MATVNLSWTAPASVGDVTSVEVWRWSGLTNSATADLETLITNEATNPEATLASTAATYSDTAAPVGDLTYAVVSRNTSGFKLEGSPSPGHVNLTTT